MVCYIVTCRSEKCSRFGQMTGNGIFCIKSKCHENECNFEASSSLLFMQGKVFPKHGLYNNLCTKW